MKFIQGNKCYVQKRDIKKIIETSNGKMHPIISNILKEGINYPPETLRETICFEGEEAIKLFNNMSWIIDYEEYLNTDIRFLFSEIDKLKAKKNQLFKEYLQLDIESRIMWVYSHRAKVMSQIEYKIESIEEMISYKKSSIKQIIPIEEVLTLKMTKKD